MYNSVHSECPVLTEFSHRGPGLEYAVYKLRDIFIRYIVFLFFVQVLNFDSLTRGQNLVIDDHQNPHPSHCCVIILSSHCRIHSMKHLSLNPMTPEARY